MVLDPVLAAAFIHGYKTVLLAVGGEKHQNKPRLNRLAIARDRLVRDPALLERAVQSLAASAVEVDAQVIAAMRSLRLKRWIYLRDTRAYSVFLDDEGEDAYAVLGLTDRLRDIIGDSGAVIETGLVSFADHFVCDGIISSVIWLGRGIRGSFNETFREIKLAGRFHTAPDAT